MAQGGAISERGGARSAGGWIIYCGVFAAGGGADGGAGGGGQRARVAVIERGFAAGFGLALVPPVFMLFGIAGMVLIWRGTRAARAGSSSGGRLVPKAGWLPAARVESESPGGEVVLRTRFGPVGR